MEGQIGKIVRVLFLCLSKRTESEALRPVSVRLEGRRGCRRAGAKMYCLGLSELRIRPPHPLNLYNIFPQPDGASLLRETNVLSDEHCAPFPPCNQETGA